MSSSTPSRVPGARRTPVQARSTERVNRIIAAATGLIAEAGVDAATTSSIARRADISLASLYRYFPNRNAVLVAVAEHQFDRLSRRLEEFLESFDLTEGLDRLLDTYLEFYRSEPGYAELWAGVQAIPELHELDLQDLYRNARAISRRARQDFPGIGEERLWNMAVMLTRSCGAVLRLAMTMPGEHAGPLMGELKRMVRCYLQGEMDRARPGAGLRGTPGGR